MACFRGPAVFLPLSFRQNRHSLRPSAAEADRLGTVWSIVAKGYRSGACAGCRRREVHADCATGSCGYRAATGAQAGKVKVAADGKAAAEGQRGVARVGEGYVSYGARGGHRLIAERERGG